MDLQNQKITSYQMALQKHTSLGGIWGAQSVKHETLNFGSCQDLGVVHGDRSVLGPNPALGSLLSWGSP